MVAPGDIVADRFRLVSPLGEGGMGAVWRAEHIHLEMPVALKLMKTDPPPGERLRKRFEREARMAAKIKSAHVVRVIDHGYHDEVPFIAMELMEGQDLRATLDRRQRLSLGETVTMVRHVARALARAHELGLVHRDIKPDNIFVCADEDGRPLYKVLDFGVVKVTYGTDGGSSLATAEGVLVGTPYYLSPEQAEATGIIDHRSDLWSLGVVAYECLAGRLPFEAPTLGRLIVEILNTPMPPVDDAGLPPAVDAWLRRALSKSPEARFASARLMSEGLVAAADLPHPRSEPPRPDAVVVPSGSTPGADLATGDTLHSDDTVMRPELDDATVDAPMQQGPSQAQSSDLPGTLEGATRSEVPVAPAPRWPLAVAAGVVAVGIAAWVTTRGEPTPASVETRSATSEPPKPASTETAAVPPAGPTIVAEPTATAPSSASRAFVPAPTHVLTDAPKPVPEPTAAPAPSPGPSPTPAPVPGTSAPANSGKLPIRRGI